MLVTVTIPTLFAALPPHRSPLDRASSPFPPTAPAYSCCHDCLTTWRGRGGRLAETLGRSAKTSQRFPTKPQGSQMSRAASRTLPAPDRTKVEGHRIRVASTKDVRPAACRVSAGMDRTRRTVAIPPVRGATEPHAPAHRAPAAQPPPTERNLGGWQTGNSRNAAAQRVVRGHVCARQTRLIRLHEHAGLRQQCAARHAGTARRHRPDARQPARRGPTTKPPHRVRRQVQDHPASPRSPPSLPTAVSAAARLRACSARRTSPCHRPKTGAGTIACLIGSLTTPRPSPRRRRQSSAFAGPSNSHATLSRRTWAMAWKSAATAKFP